MPYSELQPDGSVAVFTDDGAYIGTESFEQNQGLAPGGLAERTNNYSQPDPQQAGGDGGASPVGTPPLSASMQTNGGGMVYADSTGWWGLNAAGQTQHFTELWEARNFAEGSQTYGPGSQAYGSPPGTPIGTNPPGPVATGGAGTYQTINGPKTLQQMESELRAAGWPGGEDVATAYARTTGGAVTPPAGGTLPGTPSGSVTTAPIDLLRVQNELAYQLYLQDKLNRLEIPEFQAMDERSRAEISFNAAIQQMNSLGYYVDPQQVRSYLFGGGGQPGVDTTRPTLQRQQLELQQLAEQHDYAIRSGQLDLAREIERRQVALQEEIQRGQLAISEGELTGYYQGAATFPREQYTSNLLANPRTLVEGLLAMGQNPQQAAGTLQQTPLYRSLTQPWFPQQGQQPQQAQIPFTGVERQGDIMNPATGWPTGPSGFSFIQGRQLPVRQTLSDIRTNNPRIPLYESLASFSGQNPNMFFGDFTEALPQGRLTQQAVGIT